MHLDTSTGINVIDLWAGALVASGLVASGLVASGEG